MPDVTEDPSDTTYVVNGETAGAAKRMTDGRVSPVTDVLTQRAIRRITPAVEELLRQHGLTRFRLAGGAMMRGTPKDLDIWPPSQHSHPSQHEALRQLIGVRRAVLDDELPFHWFPKDLVAADGTKVQACWSRAESLRDLISGFDFAHCQIGAEMSLDTVSRQVGVTEVAYTDHFVNAMMVQGTYYVAGASNINSLARVPDVAAKLGLDRGETRALALQVVEEIAKDPAGDLQRFRRMER